MNIYRDFVRASSNYLSRADEAGLSITGNLTVGGWFYFDAESTGQETGLISKWYETGNERAYVLYKNASNELVFSVSDDGSVVFSITDGGFNYVESQWFYVIGRFTVSAELALFVNGMWYKTTAPASIFDCSEDFEIGRYNRTNYLDGRVSQAFICAYSVPDTFICAMYSHAKALYMRWSLYNNVCSSTTSSSSSSSSTSSSVSTSISSSSSSESYSTSSSTSCSSSSSTITSSSSSVPP
jgi:hypothetical protein